jgi:hypothetical protein
MGKRKPIVQTSVARRTAAKRLEANQLSRRTAWATLQRLHKFLEANGARIVIPEERSFESEGEAIESGLRRTVESRDTVMRSLIRAVYRFRDSSLIGNAIRPIECVPERQFEQLLLNTPAFGRGIPRSSLPPVSPVKQISAPLQCGWLHRMKL